MIFHGFPCIARCDGCGAEGETIEHRNARSGALSRADLPIGWKLVPSGRDKLHVCPDCIGPDGEPFGDRREAFDARLDHHGTSLLPVIAESVGVPIEIARLWARAWETQQRKVA
ncbi:hypothetical protein [Sphingomonas sp. SRS2]|uniref:hypothetical protein n=1 Tax=Sphingomonas sp. SRS2 TaxID=133190 RepID=UPI0006184597|nr:hypothetical protein [Sphingomonas sp. SRS2]KKC24885.1 hypothetical protein WP12_16795 [Sphingomonas sp. SRS2]